MIANTYNYRFNKPFLAIFTLIVLYGCNSAVEGFGNRQITDSKIENNSCSAQQPIAQYYFDESPGSEVIHDSSGRVPPVNLTIKDPAVVSWLKNGLAVNQSTIIVSDSNQNTADRIIDALRSSNELSVELWAQPENITQSGPARIVSISVDYGTRNMTIGQVDDAYILRLRTSMTNPNGKIDSSLGEINPITTPPGTASTELTHLVLTWDTESGEASYFINGLYSASALLEGDFSTWMDGYPLLLANEAIDRRTWLGNFYYLAIRDCTMEESEIAERYNNGIPTKN